MYNLFGVDISEDDVGLYKTSCINKIFAILGVFEDCEKNGEFDSYYTYINRLLIEFVGIYDLFNITIFLSLIGILDGMLKNDKPTHKEVKSLTFHCISLIKRGVK